MNSKYPFSFTLPNVSKNRITTAGEAEKGLLTRYKTKKSEFERAIWQLVRFYSMTGKPEEAFQWIRLLMSLTNDPEKLASNYLALGQLMEKCNDYSSAIDFYTQAISLYKVNKKTCYFSNNNIGYSLNQLNEFKEAEPYCRTAISIDPTRHNAFKNLGVSLEGQGKYIEAALAYIDAVEKEASDPRALNHLRTLLEKHPEILEMIPGFEERIISGERAVELASQMKRSLVQEKIGLPPPELSNAAKILDSIAHIFIDEGRREFSRDDVRKQAGLSREEWNSGYTSIFQAMRIDQPGGAPKIKKEYQGILRRLRWGVFTLTKYGKEYINTRNWLIVLMG